MHEYDTAEALLLDMIANTDCSWAVATAALAFWEKHLNERSLPVYAILGEHSNVIYDRGPVPRSLKIGTCAANAEQWYMTLYSEAL